MKNKNSEIGIFEYVLYAIVIVILGVAIYLVVNTAYKSYVSGWNEEHNLVPEEDYPLAVAEYIEASETEYQVHKCSIAYDYPEGNETGLGYWVATAVELPFDFQEKANFESSYFAGGSGFWSFPLSHDYVESFGDEAPDECYLLTSHWEELDESVILTQIYVPNFEDWSRLSWTVGDLD